MAKKNKKPENTEEIKKPTENTEEIPNQKKDNPTTPYKETILLRFPNNGRIEVVSDLKYNPDGKPYLETVTPEEKNQSSFYVRLDSSFIAGFFKNYRAQLTDPMLMPALYSVPIGRVSSLTETLNKLTDDPQNEILLEEAKKYRVYTQSLEKIKFDQPRMPKDQLEALGIDLETLEEDGVFKLLEQGRDSNELYHLELQVAENIRIDGYFVIHPTLDEDRNIVFELVGGNAVPEFERDENLKYQLSPDDKNSLLKGKTLERSISYNGQYCVAAYNRNTGRMDCTPCSEIVAPDFYMNARLDEAKKSEFRRGAKVRLEDCHYYNNDNKFTCELQYDALKKEAVSSNHRYSRPYIPDYLSKQLSRQQLEDLSAYKTISRAGLVDRYNNPLNRDICVSRETNAVTFVNRMAQAQAQKQTENYDNKRADMIYSAEFFPEEESQSLGRGL